MANNLQSIRLSTIVALVTDIILLSIMLLGLSRIRRSGSGTMALGRLLWNQVGHRSNVFLANRRALDSPPYFYSLGCNLARGFRRRGTYANGKLVLSSVPFPLANRLYAQVFICLDLNGIFFFHCRRL